MNDLTKQVTLPPIDVSERSIFSNVEKFEQVKYMADYLATSDMVPKEYQKKPANVLIALSMAERMNSDPMMVMQNLYIVHGKPSWSGQFLIALLNQSGLFSLLQYEFQGTEGEDNWGCRAYATDLASNEVIYGPSVTIKIAKDEGWYGRNGSKWKTLPELMLTYRSAAFFIRTRAPQISMGMHTEDEVRDMGPVIVVDPGDISRESDAQKMLDDLKDKAPAKKASPKAEPKQEAEQVVEQAVEAVEALESEESDIDKLVFIKGSIDGCKTLDDLKEAGDDIKVMIDDDELSEYEIKESRDYLNSAMTSMKNP